MPLSSDMAKQRGMLAAVWRAHQVLLVIAWEHEKDGEMRISARYHW